jgi:hypothetical protein
MISPPSPLASLARWPARYPRSTKATPRWARYRLMASAEVLRSGSLHCYENQKGSSGTKSLPPFGQTPMAVISVDSRTGSTGGIDK